MIKYLGSKRRLVANLCHLISGLNARTALDLFSGTSRVGYALKELGIQVHANDHNTYAATLARCYIQTDREGTIRDATRLINEFNKLRGEPGYFTQTFCEQSRFFQPANGARIDAIREAIAAKGLSPELESVVLVSLMEAADRVDSTTGVQMAFLKQWARRSYNELELRLPDLLPRAKNGKGRAHQLDALDATLQIETDVAYLDPPYNQHKYLGNYHIWETLALWDKPQHYGIACKRIDCRTRTSAFNSRVESTVAMQALIAQVRAQHLIISFNNEGYFSRVEMEKMLATRGKVLVLAHEFKRYVGAQIGIFNPRGEKIGSTGHLYNVEYIYIVSESTAALRRLRSLASAQFAHSA